MEELDEQLPRPTARNPEETEDSEAQKAVNELAAALVAGLPESTAEMSADQHGRWLLAQLLNWHRRENKSFWWRYFHLSTLTDEELREETDALGELTYEYSWPDPAPARSFTGSASRLRSTPSNLTAVLTTQRRGHPSGQSYFSMMKLE